MASSHSSTPPNLNSSVGHDMNFSSLDIDVNTFGRDTNPPGYDTNSPPGSDTIKIAYKELRSVFTQYFGDPNLKEDIKDPKRAQDVLWKLLEQHIKINQIKQAQDYHGSEKPLPTAPEKPEKSEKLPNDKIKESEKGMIRELMQITNDREKELKNKDKELKDKEKEFDRLKNNLLKEIEQLKGGREKDAKTYNKKIQEKAQEYEKKVQEYETKVHERDTKIQEYDVSYKNLYNQYSNDKMNLEATIAQKEEQLQNKRREYSELYKKNEELRNEASQYQSALGDARNYRLGDNDANNPTQLIKDIEIIQDRLNEFSKIKGGVELNDQNLTILLLEEYSCKYDPTDKVLPKAALQRRIIEIILIKTREYLERESQLQSDEFDDKYLELSVLISTNSYMSKIRNLINSRKGTDDVSFAAPNKIRQLVYAVFGDRGFGLSDGKEHGFVEEVKEVIIEEMNKYRKIKREDKKKDNEDMIAEIIRSVIKMFVFRLRVLEPPAEYLWIDKDAKIDPSLMEVGNLEDDNFDDLVVNLCSFPLIAVNLKSEKDRKVLVPAKIMVTKVEKEKEKHNKFNKLFNRSNSTDNKQKK